MPVRLTPNGSLLICYDTENEAWVSLEGISLSVLSQFVDVVPGTTLGHLFDIVDRDKRLKDFLSDYCSCDVEAIHRREREGGMPIEVITTFEKLEVGYRATEVSPADAVVITPNFWVYTDEVTGERRLDGGFMLLARSFKQWDCGTSLHSQRDCSFGLLSRLELRLDTLMNVAECDDDKITKESDGDSFSFSAHVQYTLLDVLNTIYEFFGDPVFDPRYQRQVDEDEELFRRRREEQGGKPENYADG